jgi:hypothetical protein
MIQHIVYCTRFWHLILLVVHQKNNLEVYDSAYRLLHKVLAFDFAGGSSEKQSHPEVVCFCRLRRMSCETRSKG